jgi:hypothetical protein
MDISVLATIAFTVIPAAVILYLYLRAARK